MKVKCFWWYIFFNYSKVVFFCIISFLGEQVVEDDHGNKVDNTEVIKSLTEGSALDSGETKRDNSKERDKKNSSKHNHKDKDRDRERKSSKEKDHRSHRSSSRDR